MTGEHSGPQDLPEQPLPVLIQQCSKPMAGLCTEPLVDEFTRASKRAELRQWSLSCVLGGGPSEATLCALLEQAGDDVDMAANHYFDSQRLPSRASPTAAEQQVMEFTETDIRTAHAALGSFGGIDSAIDAILNGWMFESSEDAAPGVAEDAERSATPTLATTSSTAAEPTVERVGISRYLDTASEQEQQQEQQEQQQQEQQQEQQKEQQQEQQQQRLHAVTRVRTNSLLQSVARLHAVSGAVRQALGPTPSPPPVITSHSGVRRESDGNFSFTGEVPEAVRMALCQPTLGELRQTFRRAIHIEDGDEAAKALLAFVSRSSTDGCSADELIDTLVRIFEEDPITDTEMARLHALQEEEHTGLIEYSVISIWIAARYMRDAFAAFHDDTSDEATHPTTPLATATAGGAHDGKHRVGKELGRMLAMLQEGADTHAVQAVWLVVDASAGWTEADRVWMSNYLLCGAARVPLLVLVNKVELLEEVAGKAAVAQIGSEALAAARALGNAALLAGTYAASAVEGWRVRGAVGATGAAARTVARRAFLEEQMALTCRRDADAVRIINECALEGWGRCETSDAQDSAGLFADGDSTASMLAAGACASPHAWCLKERRH